MQQIELCDRFRCTGCSACFDVCAKKAITMEPDEEGFLVPHINRDVCIGCGLCQKICPVISNNQVKNPVNPIEVYAGYINDVKIRELSASGGAFPAFANYFYDNGGLVAAAAFDEHLNLRHILSSKKEELSKFQGSKYLQSDVRNIYKDVLATLTQGREVLFVGTPCQVAGLKSFLRKDYNGLFTIDLVCHGVPSPQLFNFYLKQVGVDLQRVYKNFFFRSHRNSAFFHHSIQDESGSLCSIETNKHSYICAYLKGWLHRESCYRCPFSSIPRQGDCTIADFWGVLSKKVRFEGDRSKGVSMIMVNNAKGAVLFEQIRQYLYIEEKTLEEAKIDNHNLYTHDVRPKIRDIVYEQMEKMTPEQFMKEYGLKLPKPNIIKVIIVKILRAFRLWK